jgi:SPX domain protein involved in polyphosphate accumulation
MGRYITGDLDYKFWFAVQSSNAADRFGVTGYEPSVLCYYFDEENLENVEEEIKNIEDTLGEKLKIIEDFFDSHNVYTDDQLTELNITQDELSDYADLCLGKQIRDCIKETGQCSFEAEL